MCKLETTTTIPQLQAHTIKIVTVDGKIKGRTASGKQRITFWTWQACMNVDVLEIVNVWLLLNGFSWINLFIYLLIYNFFNVNWWLLLNGFNWIN